MKRVILTVGPQYAGKSTFCEKVIARFSDVVLVSRDKILIRMFGTVWLNSYAGGHYAALDVMWKEVSSHFERTELTLILDAWNGSAGERRAIVHKLRTIGASRVDGWHFITPLNTCLRWREVRDPSTASSTKWGKVSREIREDTYRRHHQGFNTEAIAQEAVFDSVRRFNSVNPIPMDVLEIPKKKAVT
jgi:predicted kinase